MEDMSDKQEVETSALTASLEAMVLPHVNSNNKKKNRPEENMWTYLPRDVGRIICIFLGNIDMLGYLLRISKEWVIFGDEQIHQEFATRVYSGQTNKKLLKVQKWGSWLEMLIHRARIRTNGFYALRTSYCKPPCNDAFWEEKKLEYTEVSEVIQQLLHLFGHQYIYAVDTECVTSTRYDEVQVTCLPLCS